MKKTALAIFTALAVLAQTAPVLASCQTRTIFLPNGQIMTCTICKAFTNCF